MTPHSQMTALLIAPNREIAAHFSLGRVGARPLEVVCDLQSYPSARVLESKIQQFRPDVLLIDVATDLERAGDLIRQAVASRPPLHAIALHARNDSQAILKALGDGASEFLAAPFDMAVQEAAAARIRKLLEPVADIEDRRGKIVVFSSAKPGSGASTLAFQTAFALRKNAARPVLLADFNLHAGILGFLLEVGGKLSVADLLRSRSAISLDRWAQAISSQHGIDLLPGPILPFTEVFEWPRLKEIIEYARASYDWTVIDLPSVFSRMSTWCIGAADRSFVVSTPDLASLHLTRRAVKHLNQLGVDSSKYKVLVNRLDDRKQLNGADLTKLFDCKIDKALPTEVLQVERMHVLGQPMGDAPEFGRAIEGLATKLLGIEPQHPARGTVPQRRALLSQT